MRGVVGRLLLVVGVFAVVAGGVAIFWGKDAAYRIPMDTDSFTRLTGEASGALAKSDTPVPVTYVVHTQVDPKRSNDDVIAMEQTSCMATTSDYCIDAKGTFVLAGDDEAVVNIGHNKFALDRRTGLPVQDQGKYVSDAELVKDYQGFVVKLPFNTEKKDYDYWDSTVGKAVSAHYAGTRTIDGLKTYRFDVTVPSQTAEIAADTQGTYAATQSVWVDPVTGAFVDQKATQTVALLDGTKLLDVDVSYTDGTVKENVSTAKSNGRSLWVVGTGLRIIAPIVGLLLIVGGVLLVRRRRA
ncbi:Protein of unknown function [Nocardioides terrae]|uniref:DUF3068 domain-containing protein n=1 Tax=Nocardioides terrae TaxID=574651 RepID=A0A1I1FZK4_9ACTN|nr:porin PorA family protein [Nocardioides terrae]SFC02493.1 Protein of unknown function [Nocardioides terrae]